MAQFLQEMTVAMKSLVDHDFPDRLFRSFTQVFEWHTRDRAVSERQEMFRMVVQLYLDMAARSYKPFTDKKALYSNCDLDVGMAKPSKQFVSHAARCGADHFVRMCVKSQTNREDLELALRSAATSGFHDYVLWFCLKHPRMAYMPAILVNALWTPDHRYLALMARCYSSKSWLAREVADHYVRKTLSRPDSWKSVSRLKSVAKFLSEVISAGFTFKSMITEEERSAVAALVDSCLNTGVWSLAVYLPILMADWDLVVSVVDRLPPRVKESYFQLIMNRLPKGMSSEDTLEAIVTVLEGSVANITAFSSSCFLPSKLRQLAELCQEEDRAKWRLFFTIQLRDWQWVEDFVTTSKTPDVIDMALVLAARDAKWDMVTELVSRSSKAEDVVTYVMTLAVDKRRPAVVELVLPHVHLDGTSLASLLRGTPLDREPGLETREDPSCPDRHKTLHIMLLLLRQAANTDLIHTAGLLAKLIALKQPALACLLLRAGVATLDDFAMSLQDVRVRQVLVVQDHVCRQLLVCVNRVRSAGTMALEEAVLLD